MTGAGAGVTKKWQVFPGRNKFCLNGRIIVGPDINVFYINLFLLVGTSIIFFVFDCPYLAENVTLLIPLAAVLMFSITMIMLLKTSFTDPGIIPRATMDEAVYIERTMKTSAFGDSIANRPPPRAKEVIIRGQNVKLKYCFTCKIFRPPRASHCSMCDNCVDHFDHHCPWVGNCVGRRNYRYFYFFTVSLSFYIVLIFICSFSHLYLLSKDRMMVDAIVESPASVIVLLITFVSSWSIFGLAGFHTYLALSYQTTNEDIKGSFSNKRCGASKNPYSFGNACLNCCYVLCGPFPSSLIDSEGFITPEIIIKQQSNKNTIFGSATSNNMNATHLYQNGVKSCSMIDERRMVVSGVDADGAKESNRRSPAEKCVMSHTITEYSAVAVPATATPLLRTNDTNKGVLNADSNKNRPSSDNCSSMDISKIELQLDDVDLETPIADVDRNSISMMKLSATTMIDTDLDLDMVEDSSSVGATSNAALIRSKQNLSY